MEPVAVYSTAPPTDAPPAAVSVKVDCVIVAPFIALLNVALSTWPIGTPATPLPGVVERTVGCATVVKLHE